MIKKILATPAGAKHLRQSAASAGRPYTIDSDRRFSFDPSRFFSNAIVAIELDNPDLLEWAIEVGSLDPNGCHDCGLVLGEEPDSALEEPGEVIRRNLLFQCILARSKECFEYLLARDDVDPNAQAHARADSDRRYNVLSASIFSCIGRRKDVTHFLRRLVEHPATDVNRPSSDDEATPLQNWAHAFSSVPLLDNPDLELDLDVALEAPLRILKCLLEGGAKVHGDSTTLGPTPFDIVVRNTVSGSLESQARHYLALDVIGYRCGCGLVTYFLDHGNSAAIVRMHGMATSALGRWPTGHVLLRFCVTFFDLSSFLFRVITLPAFVIKRRLNDFIFMDLLHFTVIFWVIIMLICPSIVYVRRILVLFTCATLLSVDMIGSVELP